MYHDDNNGTHHLSEVTIAVIPNGKLQATYNPTVDDEFWLAGRNAPKLGEDFRVRVGFDKLKDKASWRVQKLIYDPIKKECTGSWQS